MKSFIAFTLALVLAAPAFAQVGKSLGVADANTISEAELAKLPGMTRVTPPLPNEARYTLTFDRAQVSPNAVLRAVLEAGGEVVSFAEDVKQLNQAFMDLTEPGVRT